jgi:hypothetical protein
MYPFRKQPARSAKPSQTMTGMGDVIAACARVLGVTARPGCGCERRQRFLNRLVSWPGRRAAG